MENINYLFICFSDLADVDVNGKTVRDTFSFIKNENIFCISANRLNKNLKDDQAFVISDWDVRKFNFFGKFYHRNVEDLNGLAKKNLKKHSKKSPIFCILRTIAWKFSFLFWKKPLFKWIKEKQIKALVYNPGDFSFNNYLALKIAKKFNLKFLIYNTEFYYFKNWNYLKRQNFFYKIFIHQFRKSYDKAMKRVDLCVYNLQELADLYNQKFPSKQHIAFLHPSELKQDILNKIPLSPSPLFYYAGSLDKRRHVPLFVFSNIIKKEFPESKILINGILGNDITVKDLENYENIIYEGMKPYSYIVSHLMDNNIVLLSLSPIDQYAAKNNYYGFSTKLADAIASLNPIIHIGTKNVETDLLIKHKLAYVSYDELGIEKIVKLLKVDIMNKSLRFANNQLNFSRNFLDSNSNANVLSSIVKKIVNE